MQRVRAELTVEPFREGVLGNHVAAALEVLRAGGFEPEVGPFANSVEGDVADLLPVVAAAAMASFDAGATGFSLSARAVGDRDGAEEFLGAIRPVARALGARLVRPEELSADDIPLHWQGRVVAGVHPALPGDLRDGLSTLVAQVEAELGGVLGDLGRVDKQRAVRILDERGAFAFRNAVDEVADVMGVSRVTVYNYLNATRSAPPATEPAGN